MPFIQGSVLLACCPSQGYGLFSFIDIVNTYTWKPGASRRIHLLLSAAIWSAVGLMLLGKGLYRARGGTTFIVLLATAGLVAGALKSRYVLDRAAGRTIARIHTLEEGTWLGAVYSMKTWLMVAGMIVTGVLLKYSPLPTIILCFIYFTVGWALLFSSRCAWGEFFHYRDRE